MILRFLFGSLLASACFFAAALHAQTPTLSVSSCPRVDADELERLLAIELATLGSQITPVREISVICSDERVAISAQRASVPPLQAAWSLEPGDLGSVTRLLALRISELLATPPPPPVAPATPAPLPAQRSSSPTTTYDRRFALSAAPIARRQGTPKTWLFGAALAGLAPLSRHLTLRADLTFEAAQAETPYADVAWKQWTTSVAVLWCIRTPHLSLGAGPGLRGAWASLEAENVAPSQEARSLSAPWAGPLLLGHMALHGDGPWRAVLEIEGGLTALPVHGLLDGKQKVLAVDGVFVGAQLGAGYGW